MKYKKLIYFIFIHLCSVCFSEAQTLQTTYTLINFGVNQGLPSSEVYDLYQHPKTGLIWIATDRGLVRYDGHSFQTLTENDGLTDIVIIKLTPDCWGNIWCHTTTNKLCYINPQGQIKKYEFNRQLLRLTENRDLKFVSLSYDSDKTLNLTAQCTGGRISIDARGRASWHHYSSGKEKMQHFVNFYPEKPFYFYSKTRKTEFSYPMRELMFGTIHVLSPHRFLLTDGPKIQVYENKKLKLAIEAQRITLQSGRLNKQVFWVSYQGGGIDFFTKEGKKTASFLENEIVSDVLQDHEGGIWFSTVSNGIFYLKNLRVKTAYFSERVTSVAANGKEVFIGLYNGSIGKLNTSSMQYSLCKAFQNSPANVHLDRKNQQIYANYPRLTVWMGSDFSRPETYPTGTIKTNESEGLPNTYMSNYMGFMEKTTKQLNFIKTGFRITDVAVWNKRLLLASYKGLYEYYQGKPRRIWKKELNFRIDDIDPFRKGILCATLGGGCVYYAGDTILVLKKVNGLLSNLNTEVFVENDSTVWIASAAGANKIVFDASFRYTIYNYTINDGLPSNEVIDIDLVGEQICIATKKGISFISQKYQSENKKINLFLAYRKMQVNGAEKPLRKGEAVTLQHNQNNLGIFFSAVVFGKKQDLKYRYRLVPADKNWTQTQGRSVHFSSLSPGKYRFQVQATTGSGHWSPLRELYFELHPPWWKTSLFLVLTGLAVLLATGALFRFRINLKNRRIKLLETEMQVLRAQMNPHFIFNSLASIQYFILNGNTIDSNRYLVKFSRLVRGVLENAKKELVNLKKEFEILHIYLELEQLRAQNFDFEIQTGELMLETLYLPPMLIQPFVENAIWHGFNSKVAGKRGKVTIEIKQRENRLICIIDDDGIGREAAKKPKSTQKSYGIEIATTRVQHLQKIYGVQTGIIIIDKFDDEGKATGTRVEITLPIINKNEHQSNHH